MQANSIFGGTFATNSGGLVLDDGASTYDIATAVAYAIGGKAYSKATVSNGTFPTTDINTGSAFVALAASQACTLVIALNAAGTVVVMQSDVVDLDSGDDFHDNGGVPSFPNVDFDTYCPIGYAVVKNGSAGSAFTIGSSNWNATGITKSVVDVLALPTRPAES